MNLTGIFDTHAHYDDERFDEDREALLALLPQKGVCGVINCGTTVATSQVSVSLAERYGYFYAAAGIHPEEANGITDADFDALLPLFNHPKVVAVGEIGLDYYWDSVAKETQLDVFARQLDLANQLHLPVIIHDREAHEDTLRLLKQYRPQGVMHCFSGSAEFAKEILKLGLYIGLGGAATFKNARKAVEVAAMCPADRLLLETDCPYMAPVPHRGKRNDSSLIVHVAQRLAEVRGEDAQTLVDRCRENAKRLFQIETSDRTGNSLVTVTIDRPRGSVHPKYPNLVYPINYGYVAGVSAPDGDWQDAYLLGVNEPVQQFTGKLIAVIHREDDAEEKWVVCPETCSFSKEEIEDAVRFQEQFFHSKIRMI